MSQHPSLRVDSVGTKHRNVLTRLERIKKLQEENKWKPVDGSSVLGLPKVKSVKIKVKKTKEAPAEAGAAAPGAVAPAAGAKPAAAPAAKAPAAGAKPAAGKEAAKPAGKK